VNLRIPSGTGSGRKQRLKGRGLPAPSDAEAAGDQFVEVMVEAPAAKETAQIEAYNQLRQSFGG
jgi:curved DNA-binding protein